jgi:hypothetical protein
MDHGDGVGRKDGLAACRSDEADIRRAVGDQFVTDGDAHLEAERILAVTWKSAPSLTAIEPFHAVLSAAGVSEKSAFSKAILAETTGRLQTVWKTTSEWTGIVTALVSASKVCGASEV